MEENNQNPIRKCLLVYIYKLIKIYPHNIEHPIEAPMELLQLQISKLNLGDTIYYKPQKLIVYTTLQNKFNNLTQFILLYPYFKAQSMV